MTQRHISSMTVAVLTAIAFSLGYIIARYEADDLRRAAMQRGFLLPDGEWSPVDVDKCASSQQLNRD